MPGGPHTAAFADGGILGVVEPVRVEPVGRVVVRFGIVFGHQLFVEQVDLTVDFGDVPDVAQQPVVVMDRVFVPLDSDSGRDYQHAIGLIAAFFAITFGGVP
jgi:hypothetical protein